MNSIDDIDFPFPDNNSLIQNERNKIERIKAENKAREELKSFIDNYNKDVEIYQINTNILTYADCLDVYWDGKRKIVKWSEKGTSYRKEINKQLIDSNIPEIPSNIVYLHLHLDILVSYSQKDFDNVSKTIIDGIFHHLGKDDNVVKKSTVEIKKCEKGEECFLFKIEGMNEEEYEKSKLINQLRLRKSKPTH